MGRVVSGRVGLFHSILRLEWVGLCRVGSGRFTVFSVLSGSGRVGLFHSILRLEWVGLCRVGSGCFTAFSVLSESGCDRSGWVTLFSVLGGSGWIGSRLKNI